MLDDSAPTPSAQSSALTAEERAALAQTATTGQPALPWNDLKQIVLTRLREVLADYYERCPDCDDQERRTEFGEWRDRLVGLLQSFDRPPFTLQRCCELLEAPHRWFRSTRKLMSALEKLLMVTTTISVVGVPSAPDSEASAVKPLVSVANAGVSSGGGGESGASTQSHRIESEGDTVPMDIDALG